MPLNETDVQPVATLDPHAALDDLEWLDDAVGDARVVAIGESAHYNGEFFHLRHRLLRYLVERHNVSAYLQESGFVEGWLVDDWVRRGEGQLGRVMADGLTSLMGLWAPMRDQLEWMRDHNRTAREPVRFYGIDLPGSNVSLLPGLNAVIDYLAQAEPKFTVDRVILETAKGFSATSVFSAPAALDAYTKLTPARRDGLTAGLTDLTARMNSRRLDYLRRTTSDAYQRARRCLEVTVALDAIWRGSTKADRHQIILARDAAVAETVEWVLSREDRVVLGAHNGHVQRWPVGVPGMATPAATMGMRLADRLGDQYLVIGTTSATGETLNTGPDFYTGKLFTELESPSSGSLDALMAATSRSPFAADLRHLSSSNITNIQTATTLRYGSYYADLNPLEAFDIVVHLPYVTAAQPDLDTIAHSPEEVRKALAGGSRDRRYECGLG